jgi:hypothetical protein
VRRGTEARTQAGRKARFPNPWRADMFKYSEINMNFEVTLYCAE